MGKRKSISKKLRFEVFKRDSFTCQYCGKSAPSIILHVDHIKPVAENGETNLLNLITSCVDCNLGKGARSLDDSSIAAKQIKMAKELSDRKEQLLMMAQWRDGLDDLENEKAKIVEARFEKLTGFSCSPTGRVSVKSYVKQFGLDAVLNALDISVTQYVREEGSKEQVHKAFKYIPRICYWKKKEANNPEVNGFAHICNTARLRWNSFSRSTLHNLVSNAYYEHGVDTDSMLNLARNTKSWTEFKNGLNDLLSEEA